MSEHTKKHRISAHAHGSTLHITHHDKTYAIPKKIDVTQANLSNMENGRRPIGKIIAKRIQKIFGTNYRYFLE